MDNQNNQQQNQPYSYEDSGFNLFFERNPRTYNANDQLNAQISPFIESIVDNAIIYDPFQDTQSQNLNQASQQISADQISGGVLTSNNGNLSMNLNTGELSYSDGAQQLLDVGGINSQGTPNSLTITSSTGNNLVSS